MPSKSKSPSYEEVDDCEDEIEDCDELIEAEYYTYAHTKNKHTCISSLFTHFVIEHAIIHEYISNMYVYIYIISQINISDILLLIRFL